LNCVVSDARRNNIMFSTTTTTDMTNDDEEHDDKLQNNGIEHESNSDNDSNNNENATPPPPPPPKPTIKTSHCTTVCMVPPPSATKAWEALTKARLELRDPGFYRWPPHANLLYPFLHLDTPKKKNGDDDNDDLILGDSILEDGVVEALQRAAQSVKPFYVTLRKLGTFGGKQRGVLWIYPHSHPLTTHDNIDESNDDNDDTFCNPAEPLIQLQSNLMSEFPSLSPPPNKSKFHPHMTLSHFENLNNALDAQSQIESWWNFSTTPIEFKVEEVYVLQRIGDKGQFQIVATVSLGEEGTNAVQVHDPPCSFPDMPSVEDEWVYDERMKLKERRNKNGWRGRKSRGGTRRRQRRWSKEPRKVDTPEEIEAKRAARKAKREALAALEMQQQQSEENDSNTAS